MFKAPSLESHMGTISQLFKEHAGPQLKDFANDEGKLKNAALMVYKVLPMPIRLIVSEDKFATFVINNKAPLLEAINKL